MIDIWGFLLQTLTASGVVLLLMIVKKIFRDKLPPSWHFAVWSVLGIVLLLPAGLNNRYTLFRWQVVVECMKLWAKDYTFTQVRFPLPYLKAVPHSISEWIFAFYVVGVIVCLLKYAVSYFKLRCIFKKGKEPSHEVIMHIQEIAAEQSVKHCKIVEISGLPGAFVCGVIRPILAIPSGELLEDKILLHEILHLKYKDTLWSMVICFWRCIHWCNPILAYAANQAINDMESRCDQHVLELLEGEERRDYGRILLAMTNEKFAKTPGSTCINNGGKNISKRIEAISRFKKYPVGMGLVSVCIILFLASCLSFGVQSTAMYDSEKSIHLSLASARSIPCTTMAGAFDTYGKAVLSQNGVYRVVCASENEKKELIEEILNKSKKQIFPNWSSGIQEWPDVQSGYYIYNIKQCDKEAYEALFVIKLDDLPDETMEEEIIHLAVQNLRVEKEDGRWVVYPLDEFRTIETGVQNMKSFVRDLPAMTYAAEADDMRVEVKVQTVNTVNNSVYNQDDSYDGLDAFHQDGYDMTLKPDIEFDDTCRGQMASCTHLGTAAEREKVKRIGFSTIAYYSDENRTEYADTPVNEDFFATSGPGTTGYGVEPEPGWGPTIGLGGGGGTCDFNTAIKFPEYYYVKLHVNYELYAELDLYPLERQEGAAQDGE